jgi:hypothetical protein
MEGRKQAQLVQTGSDARADDPMDGPNVISGVSSPGIESTAEMWVTTWQPKDTHSLDGMARRHGKSAMALVRGVSAPRTF